MRLRSEISALIALSLLLSSCGAEIKPIGITVIACISAASQCTTGDYAIGNLPVTIDSMNADGSPRTDIVTTQAGGITPEIQTFLQDGKQPGVSVPPEIQLGNTILCVRASSAGQTSTKFVQHVIFRQCDGLTRKERDNNTLRSMARASRSRPRAY